MPHEPPASRLREIAERLSSIESERIRLHDEQQVLLGRNSSARSAAREVVIMATTFPTARASGSSRLRYEDFAPRQLARMAVERRALYEALRAEQSIRRELFGALVSPTAPDSLIEKRLTSQKRMLEGQRGAAEIRELERTWREALFAIERVSPLDTTPGAA